MNKAIISKNNERLKYLYMLISLWIGYLFCCVLFLVYSIFPTSKKKKGDIIFFPYTQPGSDGYKRRIGQFEAFLENDRLKYKVCSIFDDPTIISGLEGGNASCFRLYRKIFWKRLGQIPDVSRYDSVFIQRGLFPMYPDQRFPFLEKLAFKLNKNITID
ncbi:MAG: hypothetical protein ABIJ16_00625, partial [Bacteroidota bacterium]